MNIDTTREQIYPRSTREHIALQTGIGQLYIFLFLLILTRTNAKHIKIRVEARLPLILSFTIYIPAKELTIQ